MTEPVLHLWLGPADGTMPDDNELSLCGRQRLADEKRAAEKAEDATYDQWLKLRPRRVCPDCDATREALVRRARSACGWDS